MDNATQVIFALGNCIKNFAQKEQFEKEWKKFETLHCPYITDKTYSKTHHFEVSWFFYFLVLLGGLWGGYYWLFILVLGRMFNCFLLIKFP